MCAGRNGIQNDPERTNEKPSNPWILDNLMESASNNNNNNRNDKLSFWELFWLYNPIEPTLVKLSSIFVISLIKFLLYDNGASTIVRTGPPVLCDEWTVPFIQPDISNWNSLFKINSKGLSSFKEIHYFVKLSQVE